MVTQTSSKERLKISRQMILCRMKDLRLEFVFGCGKPALFVDECGFQTGSVVTTQDYLNSCEPSVGTYLFVVSSFGA